MAKAAKKLGAIHLKILDALKANPAGLDIYEIRDLIDEPDGQQHLDKRVRELRYAYIIPQAKVGGRSIYTYGGERSEDLSDSGHIPSSLRAKLLHAAHGRCQMCGRTIAEDGIKLELDHRIPRNWGGLTVEENLWAICGLCNGGKRDFFATFNDEEMTRILSKDSVYERISETLRLHEGEPTPSWLLEFVANADDFQDDWQKRLRELRYSVIGYEITAGRRKNPSGKWEAAYTLKEWKPLPENHKFLIKESERLKKKARQNQP